MKKTMKKIVQTGYGLGLLSLGEAKRVAGRVKKEFNLSDEESMKLARELVKNSEKASKEVLGTASRYFEAALVKSGAASKGEVKTARRLLKKRAERVGKTMKENVKKGWHRIRKKR